MVDKEDRVIGIVTVSGLFFLNLVVFILFLWELFALTYIFYN
jgi:hypothetical protein